MTSSLPHAHAKFIAFSDFDGTITTQDSNDTATDVLGMGPERRRALNVEILNGVTNFRDAFRLMIGSVAANKTFEETKAFLVKEIKLDTGFKAFYSWCKFQNIPVVIVSSGMEPIIRAIMENLVGKEAADDIEIIANEVEYGPDGSWGIKFRHPESGFGHDKSKSTGPYRELAHKPTLFFCGDGGEPALLFPRSLRRLLMGYEIKVSDLSAARAADLLFVKVVPNHTNDLSVHCIRENIPFVAFEQFLEVLDSVQKVVGGKATIAELLK